MLLDLHTHSKYSYDAELDAMEDACRCAAENGLSIIGFTDHVEFFRKNPMVSIDMMARRRDIHICREKSNGKLDILSGIELGQPHADVKAAEEFLANNDFDYIIGSVHAMPSDVDIYFLNYAEMDCDRFLHEYFDEEEKLLEFGKFDILAHIDYPLRVMKQPHTRPSFAGYMDRVESVLKKIIEKNIALELNAKGLLGWQKSVGPERFVLEKYRDLGGRLITVGSDSHAASTMGLGIEQCMQTAKEAGFSSVTAFRNKKPYQIPI